MKKMIFGACAVALVATTAFAVTNLEQLNQAVAKILAPYQDKNTQAHIEFADIQTDAVRALKAKANAFFFKTGPGNSLTLKVDDLSYDYGNGQTPTTNLEGSFGTDLTKIFSRDDLNSILGDLESNIYSIAGDYIKEYGAAVTITVNVTDKTSDAQGNLQTIKADFSIAFDMAKLPATKKAEDIPVTYVKASAAIDVSQGISVKAQAISNTQYKGFKEGELGLKEALDMLLKQEPSTMQQIADIAKQVNDYANDLVK